MDSLPPSLRGATGVCVGRRSNLNIMTTKKRDCFALFATTDGSAGYKRTRDRRQNAILFIMKHLGKIIIYTAFGLLLSSSTLWAATRTWDGGGAGNNWSTDNNWSGNKDPGNGDNLIFDNTSDTDSVIDQAYGPKSLILENGYDGTLTAQANLSLSTDFEQEAGGSTFTLGSTTFSVSGDFTFGGGTFNVDTSTIVLDGNGDANFVDTPGTFLFYKLTIDKGGNKEVSLGGDSVTVNNTLTLTDGGVLTGTVNAKGDIDLDTDYDGGDATLVVNGTGNQTLTGAGSASNGELQPVNINKGGGTLTLASTIRSDRNWTYTAGTVDPGTSTVVFAENDLTLTGSMTFNNLTFDENNTTFTIANGSTETVNGTLTFSNGTVNTGTISAKGSVVIEAAADGGSATTSLTGTTDQTITGNNNGDFTDTLNINKTSGTATITGTCSDIQNITVTDGTLDFDGGFTYTIDDQDSVVVSSGAVLNFTGSSGSPVTLRSDTTSDWTLTVNAGATCVADYVDVSYSDASGGQPIYATNSTDSGNNTNWYFIERLDFTTAAQSIDQNAVSAIMTIQVEDALGNAVTLGENITVDLTSTSGGGTFYSNAAGTAQITSVSIANGSSSANFYYKDSIEGTPTITAAENPSKGWVDATQAQTITAAIDRIVFTTAAQSFDMNTVSAIMIIQTQDASGNSINVSADTTVSLTTTSGGGTYYSDAGGTNQITSVTITSGSSNASFYYKDTNAGTPTLTAAENPSQDWTDAQQIQTINFLNKQAGLHYSVPDH